MLFASSFTASTARLLKVLCISGRGDNYYQFRECLTCKMIEKLTHKKPSEVNRLLASDWSSIPKEGRIGEPDKS